MFSAQNYYNYRTYLHKLYNQDGGIGVPKYNDLCSMIMELRDTEKNINSISINMSNYFIAIELEENTSNTERVLIISKVTNKIREFIINNQQSIFELFNQKFGESKQSFHDFLFSGNNIFCDVTVLGNSLVINL